MLITRSSSAELEACEYVNFLIKKYSIEEPLIADFFSIIIQPENNFKNGEINWSKVLRLMGKPISDAGKWKKFFIRIKAENE